MFNYRYGKGTKRDTWGEQNGTTTYLNDSDRQAAFTNQGNRVGCECWRTPGEIRTGATSGSLGGILSGQLKEQTELTEELIAFHKNALDALQAQQEFLLALRDRLGESEP